MISNNLSANSGTKFGTVALVGLPNAGKSTLVNAIVGEKVSIVTSKSHTTRERILGVCSDRVNQICMIDTPGLDQSKHRYQRSTLQHIWEAIEQADFAGYLMDPKVALATHDEWLYRLTEQGLNKPIHIIITKFDRLTPEKKHDLTAVIEEYNKKYNVFITSALKKNGLSTLHEFWVRNIGYGPWQFESTTKKTMDLAKFAEEITREQAMNRLFKDIPHCLEVIHEDWEENGNVITIQQSINVERHSQKAIVIGKNGQCLKAIGIASRTYLSKVWKKDVRLYLTVKNAKR